MIEIKHNSRNLNLFPDTSIRLSFKFPWPTTDTIPAASTYWFEIPINGNQWFFKNINFISNSSKLYKVSVELIIADLHFVADLFIKNGNFKSHKVFIVLGEVIADHVAKKLSILDYYQFLGNTTAEVIAEAANLNGIFGTNIAFPTIKNGLYFDDNPAYLGYMNAFIEGGFLTNYKNVDGAQNVNVLVAMPKLAFVLDEIFKKIDYSVENMFNAIELNRLFIFSNFALQHAPELGYLSAKNVNKLHPGSISYVPFATIVSDPQDTFDGIFYTATQQGLHRIIFKTYAWPREVTQFSSWVAVNEVIVSEQNFDISTGTTYEIVHDVLVTTVGHTIAIKAFFGNDLVPTASYIENYSIEILPSLSGNIDQFAHSFTLGQILPDITISELINKIAVKFSACVFFDFANKTVQFQPFAEINANQNYIDISEIVISKSEELFYDNEQLQIKTEFKTDKLAEDNFKSIELLNRLPDIDYIKDLTVVTAADNVVLIKNLNAFYISRYTAGLLKWEHYSDNFYDLQATSDEIKELPIDCTTLFMRADGTTPLAAIEQAGTVAEQGVNDTQIKLFNFYNNLAAVGKVYPFASNTNVLYDEISAYGTDLNNEAVYNNFQKPLADYIEQNKPIEFDIFMTMEYFKRLIDLFKAKNDTRKLRVGSRKFIPETLDITVKMNGFGDTKIRIR